MREKLYYTPNDESQFPTVKKIFQIDGKGVAEFDLKDLNITSQSYQQDYEITAIVKETLTGIFLVTSVVSVKQF